MIARFALLCFVGVILAGCQTTGPASVKGGECRIFERPEFAVRGKRQYDQDWIDGNVEAGVGGCGWRRPKPRPASLDAVPGQKAVAVPAKRKGVVQRVKDRFMSPAAPVIESPPPVVVTVPAPAPKPRDDPVDELLNPAVR